MVEWDLIRRYDIDDDVDFILKMLNICLNICNNKWNQNFLIDFGIWSLFSKDKERWFNLLLCTWIILLISLDNDVSFSKICFLNTGLEDAEYFKFAVLKLDLINNDIKIVFLL